MGSLNMTLNVLAVPSQLNPVSFCPRVCFFSYSMICKFSKRRYTSVTSPDARVHRKEYGALRNSDAVSLCDSSVLTANPPAPHKTSLIGCQGQGDAS